MKTNKLTEEALDSILRRLVIDCNDGPTPWAFDEDVDPKEPFKYRKQIMKLLEKAIQAEREKWCKGHDWGYGENYIPSDAKGNRVKDLQCVYCGLKNQTNKLREEIEDLLTNWGLEDVFDDDLKFDRFVNDVVDLVNKAKSQWKQEALKAMPEEKDITELVKRSDLHKKYKDQLSYDLGDNQGYNQAIQECKKAIRES